MEVKINKEIRNYTESMFFGLSLRQFFFSVFACGVAVGLFFLLRGRFGTETLSWMCILGASPFAVMGFVRYNGVIDAHEKGISGVKKKRGRDKRRAARRKAVRKKRKQAIKEKKRRKRKEAEYD